MPEFNINPTLKRYPHHPRDLLQAWDSADELILQHVSQLDLKGKRVLVLNDQFGALSCALEGLDITVYTDSYVSFKGIELNSQGRIQAISQLNELSGTYDFVLIRVPKNMSFFEDQLCHLTRHLHTESKIICGVMIKHMAKASFDLLAKYIGETSTSLAQKKARLIFAEFQRSPVESPYPLKVSLDSFAIPFVNHSNLFSREKLDIGTRFLLDNIPEGDYKTILDLGCGNGVVGIAAKKLNPRAEIIFSDESKMAIQSAQANYANYFPKQPATETQFKWINCYEDQAPASVDLVICNPPFHQGNTLGDHIAWQMFKDAHHVLKPGGVLRVIGNSHLKYHQLLKKIFGGSESVANNSKFMIMDSVRSYE